MQLFHYTIITPYNHYTIQLFHYTIVPSYNCCFLGIWIQTKTNKTILQMTWSIWWIDDQSQLSSNYIMKMHFFIANIIETCIKQQLWSNAFFRWIKWKMTAIITATFVFTSNSVLFPWIEEAFFSKAYIKHQI